MKEIKINKATNGIRVNIGCWELVYVDMKMFFADLRAYFKDPEKTEAELRKRWKIKDEGMTLTTTSSWPSFPSNTDEIVKT